MTGVLHITRTTSHLPSMLAYSTARNHRRGGSSARIIFLAACLFFAFNAQFSRAEIVTDPSGEKSAPFPSTTPAATDAHNGTGLLQTLRNFMASDFISVPPSLTRKLLGADLRPECSLALLRTVNALKKLEPWALRLLDATGKYPTGALQLSRADPGAFDECLETEVSDVYGNVVSHGQYCNLVFNLKKGSFGAKEMEFLASLLHPKFIQFIGLFNDLQVPFLRIGLCFLDDCTQSDLQALVDTVAASSTQIQVANCVTAAPEPWSTTQIGIVAFLCVLVTVIAAATVADLYMDSKMKAAQKGGVLPKIVMVFSAASNTRTLFRVADKTNPDQYSLSFLHGMRAISVGYIVLGHCYQPVSDIWGRHVNIFIDADHWASMVIAWAFDSVDTFFFLSGFLLCLAVTKQKRSGPLVLLIAFVRRLIRTCVPLFFVIMCIYVLPRFVTGPDTKGCFQKLEEEIAETWWALLLQIRNFLAMDERTLFVHLWYLSADFQLFFTSLLILLVLKNRKKFLLATFAALSLLGCAIALWTATNPDVLPFMAFPAYTKSILLTTFNFYYLRPFYHAVCFFGGCMTLLILDNLKNRKISKAKHVACCFLAVTCAFCVIFMKLPWYSRRDPTTGAVKLVAAFFERVLWSLFLSLFTLTCATGRGGENVLAILI